MVLVQLLVLQVVYVLVGVGFGLLAQNTPLAVVTYLLVPSLLAPVVLLVPSLREVGSWIDLSSGTAPLMMAAVADAGQWARVATVTALWAGVPFVLGWLRLQPPRDRLSRPRAGLSRAAPRCSTWGRRRP